MPATNPALTRQAVDALLGIGDAIHRRRKELRLSATAVAEAAGISRVTLHRIEKGEASVTVGSYLAACVALGLDIELVARETKVTAAARPDRNGWIPATVRLADYPKLKELAWQVHGAAELTPREALGIYERNWRHVDPASLSTNERDLVEALRQGLGGEPVV